MIKQLSFVAFAAGVLTLSSTPAIAEPAFARAWKNQFGYTPSCNACHKDGGGTPVNEYGLQYKDAGMNVAAFARIADKDADGDGANNGVEIAKRANPGSKRSTPDDPGQWLDTSNLIPQEVQAVFAGVTTYKPLDAIFTDSEIKRAAAMGVPLSEADETTIYLPVADRKPVGTAIIVPGTFEGQSYYVLLATDRQLTVTSASALDAGAPEEARDPALYAAAVGVKVADLPAAQGDSLAASVTNTIKKAGTMLLVRLKKSG